MRHIGLPISCNIISPVLLDNNQIHGLCVCVLAVCGDHLLPRTAKRFLYLYISEPISKIPVEYLVENYDSRLKDKHRNITNRDRCARQITYSSIPFWDSTKVSGIRIPPFMTPLYHPSAGIRLPWVRHEEFSRV